MSSFQSPSYKHRFSFHSEFLQENKSRSFASVSFCRGYEYLKEASFFFQVPRLVLYVFVKMWWFLAGSRIGNSNIQRAPGFMKGADGASDVQDFQLGQCCLPVWANIRMDRFSLCLITSLLQSSPWSPPWNYFFIKFFSLFFI